MTAAAGRRDDLARIEAALTRAGRLLAAGLADATWTLEPEHEWDVAGGAALVLAAGGTVRLPDGSEPRFNRPRPWLPGFLAANESIAGGFPALFAEAVG